MAHSYEGEMRHGVDVEPGENGSVVRTADEVAHDSELLRAEAANAEHDLAEAARLWQTEAEQTDDD